MPVMAHLQRRFETSKPLAGQRIAGCLHVTKETAVLIRALRAAGAELAWSGCNPLSTQDDVAAALAADGLSIFAWHGLSVDEFYWCIDATLEFRPTLTLDDGADLIFRVHSRFPELAGGIRGGTEETTTGVQRLQAMADDGKLRYPVVAVNNAETKWDFDNVYGTGQSALDGVLRNVTRIDGDLGIFGNEPLDYEERTQRHARSLGDEQAARESKGSIFSDGEALSNLEGLRNLQSIGGSLKLGLPIVGYNFGLTTLEGLRSLQSIEGDLHIQHNFALTSLKGLHNVQSVGGELHILHNDLLTTMEGLDNLRSVGDNLSLYRNISLTSLEGLHNVQSVGDELIIRDNRLLTSLEGLRSLQSVGRAVMIWGSDTLKDLKGLDKLTRIENLLIHENASLTSLKGLDNLQSVGNVLQIDGNRALASLDGLDNLQSVGGHLWIEDNPNLPDDLVQEFAARMIEGGFGGEITIMGTQP